MPASARNALHLLQARFEAARRCGGPAHRAQGQLGVQVLADLVGDAQIFDQRRGDAAREFDTGGRLGAAACVRSAT